MTKKHLITGIEKNSVAEEMGIEPGDFIISVNGKEIADVFDYRYFTGEEYFELLIEKPCGEEWLLEIEKDREEELGLIFDSGLMDEAKSCRNKCIFCFIDQLPRGMRETLYFKDDDSRLSFLTGNYVTLTNVSDIEFEKVLYYHLSPINISVHTTNAKLREEMLKNKHAGRLKEYLDKLSAAGIEMNFQIVLCKGVNDGEELERTITDLAEYFPHGKSLSVVPVGISDHRDGLYPLESFEKEDALKLVGQISRRQAELKEKIGTSFVFAADEFYIKAGVELPPYEHYEDFPQIENGVGMVSRFRQDFFDGLSAVTAGSLEASFAVVTGTAAAGLMNELCAELKKHVDGLDITVYDIRNDFFGENITVSGLLTGRDMLNGLKDIKPGQTLLIPSNALRSGETVFLDDLTVKDISDKLGVKVVPIADAYHFINVVTSQQITEE